MRIRTLKNFLHDRNYRRGEELDVTGSLARQLIHRGMAVAIGDEQTEGSDDGKSVERSTAGGEKPGKPEKSK